MLEFGNPPKNTENSEILRFLSKEMVASEVSFKLFEE